MKRVLFLVLIIGLFALSGCGQEPSEIVLAYQENSEIIGSEKDSIIGEVSDTIYDSIDRSNAKAEEIFLGPIEGQGVDITPPEGRYRISADMPPDGMPQSGRILVHDEEGVLLLSEIIDYSFAGSVTVDLSGSHTVHIDGLDYAMLIPEETKVSDDLSAGIWEVGKDIAAGNYSIFPTDYGFGDLQIFEEGKSPRLFEFLNTSPETAVELELKEGQKLKITGIYSLKFKPL
ncbi:LptM family lipoprotein [Paucisalibacillus globulus]|uniref:LptM family lipoprotein n=1 Tax=Paucisalibacillus globulus TaxID=351095 RepID=UPI000BB70D67|nr:hypothetical protein [Paucisalibacillus globulus]